MSWPRGTVAFLFTDIEGSTGLWERFPGAMPAAYARHDAVLRVAVEQHAGVVYKVIGDAFQVAFLDARSAVAAALDAQRALTAEAWGLPRPLRVRMALHACQAEPSLAGDYRTPGLNRLGRLLAAGHGGQILLSAALANAVHETLPEGAALRNLGERRLKDLPGTEPVYQLAAPGLLVEFPPLKTLDARPHDLPEPPSPLIGREDEVAAVRGLLRDGRARPVTLTGPGGIGKTRLAVAAAAGLVDEFADGVRWVPLASLTDPSLVISTVAVRLGVKEEPGRLPAEALVDWLRGRELLLVLDNCEQVLDGVADAVAGWLETAPGLRVLATSRGRLRLRAERTLPVEPLAIPSPAATTLADVAATAAGAFFLDRGRASADLAAADADAPAIAGICALLDGLPLAIELAAARLDRFAPTELAERLARRLPELADGPRDLPARQRTLRDTIAWSYDLLDEREQAVFRGVSVFAGGCVGEDARLVVTRRAGEDATELVPLLDRLVERSLLRSEAEPHDDDLGRRYRFLETIREFGLDRLATAGEADVTQERFATHVLTVAERAAAKLAGPDQAGWLARLDREQPNLRAAAAWIENASRAEWALRLAGALVPYWKRRGQLAEGRTRLERALALADAAGGAREWRLKAYVGLGSLAFDQSDFDAARQANEACLAFAEGPADAASVAAALLGLGAAAYKQGDYAAACARFEAALSVFRELGDQAGMARVLNNLGLIAWRRDEIDRAEALLGEAVAAYRMLGEAVGEAMVLSNLAGVARDRGANEQAVALCEAALAIQERLGDLPRMANSIHNLGELAAELGDRSRAADRFAQALTLWREMGNAGGEALTLQGMADLWVDGGEPAQARDAYVASIRRWHEVGEPRSLADGLDRLGALLAGQDDARGWAAAVRLLGAAAALRARHGLLAISADQSPNHHDAVVHLRRRLGPAAFEATWQEAADASVEALVSEALAAPLVAASR